MAERTHEFDPIKSYDRPGLAVARLMEGNLGAASRAAFLPRTLSPAERKSLISSLIGEKQVDTPYGQALAVLTNPFVILGAVLAVRYPVQSAVNLTKLASRVGGYERYINPVAKLVGSLEETFAGTKVPNLIRGLTRAISDFRVKYLGAESELGLTKLLHGYEERAGRQMNSTESYRIVLKAAGLDKPNSIIAKQLGLPYVAKPIQLTRAESWFHRELTTKWLPGHYADGLKGKEVQLLKTLRESGIVASSQKEIKELKNFWPQMIPRTVRDIETETQALMSRSAYGQRAVRAARKVSTVHAADRRNAMLPSRADLKMIPEELLHPELLKSVEQEYSRRAARFSANPEQYSPPKEFSLNMVPTLERYTNSIARAFGWTGHPAQYGKALAQEVRVAEASGPQGIVKAEMLQNTYMPWALGKQTFVQGVKAAEWAGTKAWAVGQLKSPTIQKHIPKVWRDKLTEMITMGHTLRSPGTAGGGLVGWFYTSTLGLNPASAMLNLMQTLLTTAPTIGAKWTYRGMASTFKKGSQYFRLRAAGLADEMAQAKAFPEFAQAGLTNLSVHDSGALNAAWDAGTKLSKTGSVVDRVKGAMMALFSTTERFNRFTAFEGARLKGLSEGVRGQAALDFGARIMEKTQFTPGITGTPYGLINLPPWLKQFTTFGTKYSSFLLGKPFEAAREAGIPGLAGRSLGTLGRMALTSGLTYEAGKRLFDVDLTGGLMFGALPGPRGDSPLGVLPFAPPALTIPAAVAQSVIEEDLTPIQKELPLFIPAGVAAARAFGPLAGRVLPQTVVRGVSKFIGKEYADYTKPTEDGRYSVYDKRGALKGNFTGLQLLMKASGLPVGDMQRENEFMGYLLKQREQMRGLKKSYLDAYMNNDPGGQKAIQDEFKQRYQFELPVKKSDIKGAEMRRDVTRLERLLQTLPKDSRPQFGAILGTAISSQTEALLGVNPAALQSGTVRSRRLP